MLNGDQDKYHVLVNFVNYKMCNKKHKWADFYIRIKLQQGIIKTKQFEHFGRTWTQQQQRPMVTKRALFA